MSFPLLLPPPLSLSPSLPHPPSLTLPLPLTLHLSPSLSHPPPPTQCVSCEEVAQYLLPSSEVTVWCVQWCGCEGVGCVRWLSWLPMFLCSDHQLRTLQEEKRRVVRCPPPIHTPSLLPIHTPSLPSTHPHSSFLFASSLFTFPLPPPLPTLSSTLLLSLPFSILPPSLFFLPPAK